MWLLIAFIAVPLIEIALFIQVGGAIGLWPTLLVVVVTAVLGTFLVRQQGLAVLNQIRGRLNQMDDPTEPLAHGAMILFSGALLLTPGFFTDAIGFALLVPSIRTKVFQYLRARIQLHMVQQNRPPHRPDPSVIDGDFTEVDPEPRRTTGPSGWTKDDTSH